MSFLSDILSGIKNVLTWWVTITPWESGLRVRTVPFRPVQVVVLKAGIHWAFPLVDKVYRQSIRLRVCDLPVQTLTTIDGKCLTLKGMLGYEIKNIKKLYDKLQHGDDALVNLATGHIAEYVVTRTQDALSPAVMESEILSNLDFGTYGLGNIKLRITDFAYVKAYRLIQGDNWYTSGDSLRTDEAVRIGGLY